jgi:uncharacterized protein (DUF2336 family)
VGGAGNVTAALLATYLANRPAGEPEAYLIAASVVCAVALTWAGWTRDVYRALMAAAVGMLALALLTH